MGAKIEVSYPKVFTCPTTQDEVEADELGDIVINPCFSNREKMLEGCDGCNSCDIREAGECDGPVEYMPVNEAKVVGKLLLEYHDLIGNMLPLMDENKKHEECESTWDHLVVIAKDLHSRVEEMS